MKPAWLPDGFEVEAMPAEENVTVQKSGGAPAEGVDAQRKGSRPVWLPDGFNIDTAAPAEENATPPAPPAPKVPENESETQRDESFLGKVIHGAKRIFEAVTPFNNPSLDGEGEIPVEDFKREIGRPIVAGIENVTGIDMGVKGPGEPEKSAHDAAADIREQLNNIEWRYKDLADAYKANSGDPAAVAALRKKRVDMEDEMLKLLAKRGIEGRFTPNGELMVMGEDGKPVKVEEDSALEGLMKSLYTNAGEAVGLGAGAAAGLKAGMRTAEVLPGPAKALAIPVAVTAGAAAGAGLGRDYDVLRSALKLNKDLALEDYVDAGVDAAAANALMNVAAEAGRPVAKAAGKAALNGAEKAVDAAYYLPGKLLMKDKEVAKMAESELSDEEAKRQALDLLDYAEKNGITLTGNQLTDSQRVAQITQILARNPGVRDSFRGLSRQNTDILYGKMRELLDELAPKAPKDAIDAGVADVAGERLKEGIGKALEARRTAISKAYDDFEKAVSGKVYLKKNLLRDRLNNDELNDFIRLSNNPEGYKAVIDTATKKVDDLLRKNRGRLTAKELDAVNKQMNALSKNVNDPTILDAYKKVRNELNDEIEALSAKEGNDAYEKLMKARRLHGEKEKIYGRRGEYTAFRKALDTEKSATIVDRMLMSPEASDNALLLRQELSRVPGGKQLQRELLRSLIDKKIDNALKVTDFASTGKIGTDDFLKALTSVDDRVVRTLADEKTAKEINDIARLLKTVQKQEKLLAGTGAPMATDSSSIAGAALKWLKRIGYGALWGRALTTPASQKMFKQMLKLSLKDVPKGGEKRAVREIDALGRQIVKRSGGDLDAIMKQITDERDMTQKSVPDAEVTEPKIETIAPEEIDALRNNPPSAEEARVMERLGPQDKYQTFAQDIRYIREGRASDAQLRKYLEAKKAVDPDVFAAEMAKETAPNSVEEALKDYPHIDAQRFLKDRLDADLRKEPYGFAVNKEAAKRILAEKATPEDLRKLADDVAHIDADPQWREHYGLGKVEGDTYISPEGEEIDLNTVFSNQGKHMAAGFAGGTANVFENADQNGDGVVTEDEAAAAFAKGFLAGAIAPEVIKVLGKTNPKLYAKVTSKLLDETANGMKASKEAVDDLSVKLGTFVGSDPRAAGAFSDVATKKVMREIDDSSAKFNTHVLDDIYGKSINGKAWNASNPKIGEGEYKAYFLRDLIDHPELFEKYPDISETNVIVRNLPNESFKGRWNGQYIELNIAHGGLNKKTLLHEIQHMIQQKEGWPTGGSARDFMHPNAKEFDASKTSESPHESYGRIWGEQQARATQYRADMNPDQRSKEGWTQTLEKAEGTYKEPIIKHHGNKAEHAKELEERYLNKQIDKVLENKLMKEAEPLPKPKSFKEFVKDFGTTGWAKVKTPIGNISINVKSAYRHFTENTHYQDRSWLTGALKKTLEDPLFIVNNPTKKQIEFYKPFEDSNGAIHYIGIAKRSDGNMRYVTSFDRDNIGHIKKMIKATDGNLLYFKHSRYVKDATVNGGTSATKQGWENGNVDESITQNPKKRKIE